MSGQKQNILSSLYPRSRRRTSKDGGDLWDALSPQASSSSVLSTGSSKSLHGSTLSPHQSHSKLASKSKNVVEFDIRLETPPAIMYGTPEASTGALISGICDVDLTNSGGIDGVVSLIDVSMTIVQEIRYTLPVAVAKNLPKGTHQRNVLATWDILKHPHILASKTFSYPFSHLLPGTLPPTTTTPLFKIEYFIHASATTKDMKRSEASLKLPIGRSVIHVTEKTSVRVFPPTDLSLSLILPSALFPNSQVMAQMRLEGLVTETKPPADAAANASSRYKRWLLKRINCRVDEIVKVKWGKSDEEEFEHKQTLSYNLHKSGWKTDFELQNGHIEFDCPDFCNGALQKATKDLKDPVLGLSVSHQLICELLIAEEVLSSPTATQGILSGSARVLRMQFAFPVVDRPGLGISWDDEVPPVYADIPLSPPEYHEVHGLPSLEEIHSSSLVFSPSLSPTMSPTLRHLDPNIKGFEHQPSTPRIFPSLGTSLSGLIETNKGSKSKSGLASASSRNSLRPVSSQPVSSSSGLRPTYSMPSRTNTSHTLNYNASDGSVSSDSVASVLEEPQPPPKIKHKR